MGDLRVLKGEVLPPYDPDRVCPKCGHDDVGAAYVPGCPVDQCEAEHIGRNCRRCRFEWAEGVLS